MSDDLQDIFQVLPAGLSDPLISCYQELLDRYRGGDWEGVGLKAGKIVEIVYSIINGEVTGQMPTAPSKPPNMVDACMSIERTPKGSFPRSIRIQIPRALCFIYELRNNRAIGHVSGEIDPNHMDAEMFLRASKWLLAELVRYYGQHDVNDAREVVESVTTKTFHIIWEGGERKRILNASLTAKQKSLVFLYFEPGAVPVAELMGWVEYKNSTDFKRNVLLDLHKKALVDFDKKNGVVRILPPGKNHVEQNELLKIDP